jgi:hypothetical protein
LFVDDYCFVAFVVFHNIFNFIVIFLISFLSTARLGSTCKQDTYVSRVCHTKVKVIFVTLVVFNCEKL